MVYKVVSKIKVKVGNLFNIVYTSNECMATTSIDCVKYKTDEEISNWMQSLKNIGSNFPKYAEQCLFIKRKPFEHESEVRIIISKDTQKTAESFIVSGLNVPKMIPYSHSRRYTKR